MAMGYPDYLVDAGGQAIKGHTEVRDYTWEPAVLVTPIPCSESSLQAA